jgi:ABC-type lipoprotein release transport system permease subunit
MNVLVSISLRNLVRQKRRNILLGSAIAFGMMILLLANSFSHGLSDVIFNRILRYTSGHVSVAFSQNGNMYRMLFKDGDRIMAIAKREIPDVSGIQEAIGIMARAIGNAATDNVIMVGMDPKASGSEKDKKDAAENFKMLTGSFKDISRTDVENPTLLAENKAKTLNVKCNDILRVRYQDIHGQNQAARLTVVGIFKPANIFMSAPIFLNLRDLKRLGGYGPHDIGQLYIILNKDPRKFAVGYADKLHAALEPGLAAAFGTMQFAKKNLPALALCFKNDSGMRALLDDSLKATASVQGRGQAPFFRDGIVLACGIAKALGVRAGDTCAFSYRPKYEAAADTEKLAVTAVLAPTHLVPDNSVLVNERRFYGFFYDHWPRPVDSIAGGAGLVPLKSNPIYGALAPEWLLLKRTKTTTEMQKQTKEVTKLRSNAFTVNVQSMYESASMVVNLEKALNLITFAAVMVLFFIILVGVVNTLRMTIRERTREIGTVRAIGMQKKDVRNSFLLETGFLALFSTVAGTILGFVAMAVLSLVKINAQDNPLGMLLVNGHLNFAPTLVAAVGYNILIVAIAVATAYFPARRASNLSAAAAFRHYE